MDKKYKKIVELGEGAFGKVFKVEDEQNQTYAAKFMEQTDPTAKSEMDVLSRVRHPNIIHYIEAGPWGDQLCIILELADAGTLTMAVMTGWDWDWDEPSVWRFAGQLASALAYLHGFRPHIMHRDLKPDNILGVTTQGQVSWKIADFGLAKLLTQDAQGRYYADTEAGTENYMAPEVLNNFEDYTFSADIWSLGAVITFYCNGQHKFTDCQMIKTWRKKATISSGKYSKDLVELVASMLDPKKRRRPSAEEIVQHCI